MFSQDLNEIEHSKKNGYIYLFKILIDNNSFKFGHTTKNIKDRLSSYRHHIYDIHYVNCSLVKEREYLIKHYLLNDILFNCIQGEEYFSGPFNRIVYVFKYISSLDDENVLYYIRNKHIALKITFDITEDNEEKKDDNIKQEKDDKKEKIGFNCDICDRTFKNYKALRLHKKIHSREIKEHKCLICNKIYKSKQNLENHSCKVKKEIDNKTINETLIDYKKQFEELEIKYNSINQENDLIKEDYEQKLDSVKEKYIKKLNIIKEKYKQVTRENIQLINHLKDKELLITLLQKNLSK